jgi:lipopolysaccharide export system permease protein
MKRLSAYLIRLFAVDGIALFVIMLVLMWMTQWLRLFDLVSAKGQSLVTLFGQAALSLPPLSVVFLYVTLGIGFGRALLRLQSNLELHIIHASRQVPALLQSILIYALLCAVAVALLANVLAPVATRNLDDWTASIAADLVGRTLVPHRFTEVSPGVVIAIGGRGPGGEITDFFADDRRDPKQERTYIAKSAKIGEDQDGYVLQLQNGVLQYDTGTSFSEISFQQYNIGIDRLTGASGTEDDLDSRSSLDLVGRGMKSGVWPDDVLHKLIQRADEPLRVLAMFAFVTALLGLPHARRGRGGIPIELAVLVAAFLERGLTSYAPLPYLIAPLTGALVLLVGSGLVLMWRFRVLRPPPSLERVAA